MRKEARALRNRGDGDIVLSTLMMRDYPIPDMRANKKLLADQASYGDVVKRLQYASMSGSEFLCLRSLEERVLLHEPDPY